MSKKRILIINIPVIHRGFLDFFEKNIRIISEIYIVERKMLKEVFDLPEDIASFDFKASKKILGALGFKKVRLLDRKSINLVKDKKVLLVNDQFSRKLAARYFNEKNIKWDNVFLRWDADSVLAKRSMNEKKSRKIGDTIWMKEAYKEARKSGCWWRNVGSVVVKDGAVIFRAYNEALPSDYTPYQVGNIRDYVKAGEKQELSSTIHSEQKVVAEAARKGISLDGTSLYVTHFPCPVCTKLIISSGIKCCFFSEGTANLDGEKLFKLFGVKLLAVSIKK